MGKKLIVTMVTRVDSRQIDVQQNTRDDSRWTGRLEATIFVGGNDVAATIDG